MQGSERLSSFTRNPQFRRRLEQRRRSDARFRTYGIVAVGIALALLITLLSSIAFEARSAFTRHKLMISVSEGVSDGPALYDEAVSELLRVSGQPEGREARLSISRLISPLAAHGVLAAGRDESVEASLALSDDADLYLKGHSSERRRFTMTAWRDEETVLTGNFKRPVRRLTSWQRDDITRIETRQLRPARREAQRLVEALETAPDELLLRRRLSASQDRIEKLEAELAERRQELERGEIALTVSDPVVLVRVGRIAGRVTRVSETRIEFEPVLSGLRAIGDTHLLVLRAPVSERTLSDLQIAVLEEIRRLELTDRKINWSLFVSSDSSEAELAGLAAGLAGSILLILVTMLLAVPVGIAAAVYLEEFAPRNRLTNFIQVNINNLAAVPSIVFGLLGAAILINGIVIPLPFLGASFTIGGGLGRGWPLVGGVVLALMTLPTIIIASRAALRSVPNSVRQGALAVGATRLQMIHHHVLPIAGPGILTGSIIGLAQALGETAPLLLIGMVAFIADAPTGMTDRSSALPVLIYQWSTRAERAWEPMTSAAIIVLLALMLVLNGVAVWLRMRYEKQ